MTETIRWGIIGTGSIAARFVEDLRTLPDAEVAAVGSRSAAGAESFGQRYGIPHRHSGYESLVADPDVDVVYVATPNAMHHGNTLMAIDAGKAVLCEKPLALDAAQAAEMIAAARTRGVFLMEGMWTRFVPAIVRLREMLAERVIGEIEHLSAEYGFRGTKSRLFDPALGGGVLLDIGVYPVALCSMVFGPPDDLHCVAHCGDGGIDERAAFVLGYDGGRTATAYVTIRADIPPRADLTGSEGRITLYPPFYCTTRIAVSRPEIDDLVIEIPLRGRGYLHEAEEVMACLRANALESEGMPLDESLQIMETLDRLRGLHSCDGGS